MSVHTFSFSFPAHNSVELNNTKLSSKPTLKDFDVESENNGLGSENGLEMDADECCANWRL